MNLTKRGEYALRTLIRIGLAQELGREVVAVSELAEAERLPLKFVEQILLQLRGAGYIETRRGKLGGYRIAKPLEQISVAEVVAGAANATAASVHHFLFSGARILALIG